MQSIYEFKKINSISSQQTMAVLKSGLSKNVLSGSRRAKKMKNNYLNTTNLTRFMCLTFFAYNLLACNKGADSFSLLPASSNFKASSSFTQKKIDILWVIDNSGSMQTSQANLAANFNSFINNFSTKGYDFHMGVVTTDSYFANHYNDNNRSKLRDGLWPNFSGVPIMDKNTPNLNSVFITNITQGTNGSGDERAFSSFRHALQNPLNAGFRRPGAYLSIIIVSDEDDTSHYDWANGISSYCYFYACNPSHTLYSIQYFTDFLNQLTNYVSGPKEYSVNAITVTDTACANAVGTYIGNRYMQLAAATGGIASSICANFNSTLDAIALNVISQASIFQLDRTPVIGTIQVSINGTSIPESSSNGWTYDATNNTIELHGSALPSEGDDIQVNFEPTSANT